MIVWWGKGERHRGCERGEYKRKVLGMCSDLTWGWGQVGESVCKVEPIGQTDFLHKACTR
jgi:hypothetical protein